MKGDAMRRALFIAAISGCLVGAVQLAHAADMATKAPMPEKAPMALPIVAYNWNGFYVGGNFGYGWNDVSSTATNLATGEQTSSSSTRRGVFGGGQVGYNWQFNPNWLVGLEGDLDAASLTGSSDSCSSTGCSHSDGKNDWFGTLRGRVGFVQNNWLLFATGGVAWVHGSNTRTITAVNIPPAPAGSGVLVGQASTASGTDAGWTVGGGVDWGIAPNWSVNLEYRYMDVKTSRDYTYSLPTAARHSDNDEKISTVRISLDYHFH
jgi:outer membrane immunogenic protein